MKATHPNGSPGVDPASTPGETVPGLFEGLWVFVEGIAGSAQSLVEVQKDRILHAVRRKLVQGVLAAAAGLCAALFLGGAVLALLRGMCGGFAVLCGNSAWAGDLCGGALALLLGFGAAALALRSSSRRELARLKEKYERIRHEQDRDTGAAQPAGDGGGAARPRGGAGDPAADALGAAAR